MKNLGHGYRIIVKFNDGTEDAVYEYANEKVADSVVRTCSRSKLVTSVEKEEF